MIRRGTSDQRAAGLAALQAARPQQQVPMVQPTQVGGPQNPIEESSGDPIFDALWEAEKKRINNPKLFGEGKNNLQREYGTYNSFLNSLGDVSNDPNVARTLNQYKQAFSSRDVAGMGDLKTQLEQYADTARTMAEQKKLKDEGRTSLNNTLMGTGGQPGTIQNAFELAQPVLQQELARLGILHGGALTQHSEQVAKELDINRQQQMSAYDLGQLAQAQGINIDSLNSILGLRNQQRAQNLALQLGQQNSAAMQAAARAQAQAQKQAAMWGMGGSIIGGAVSKGGIWGK